MSRSRHQHKKTYKLGIPSRKVKKISHQRIRAKERMALINPNDEKALADAGKKLDYWYYL